MPEAFATVEIDEETRDLLLDLLPPTGWNLVAQFFDQGGVQTAGARDAVMVEDFLKALMHHPQFKTRLEEQHQARQRRNLSYQLGDEDRKVTKINGAMASRVKSKRAKKKRG